MKSLISVLMKAGTPEHAQKHYGPLPFILSIFANCLWPISWLYCNENKVSFAQSTMARGISTLIFSYIACQYSQSSTMLQYRSNFKLLLVRSIFMTLHSFFVGIAQFILPLPVVHTIACSGTLFVFIIDYLINGTSINSRQVVGIIIGLSGVFLVGNGNLLTKWIIPDYQYKTKYQNYMVTDPILVFIFTFFYVIITILWAYAIVITRLAKANTFQINFILGIVFYFLAVGCLPYMGYFDYSISSTFVDWFKVILFTGVPCFVVQILVITSLTMTKQTGVLNICSFTMVFVSYLISIFRYHERPNLLCLVGIFLVIFGCAKTLLFTKFK